LEEMRHKGLKVRIHPSIKDRRAHVFGYHETPQFCRPVSTYRLKPMNTEFPKEAHNMINLLISVSPCFWMPGRLTKRWQLLMSQRKLTCFHGRTEPLSAFYSAAG